MLNDLPPLWQAYLDAVDFGFDGWFIDGEMQYQWPGNRYRICEDMQKQPDRWVVRYRGRIDELPYHEETVYPIGDPPTATEKIIKDLEADWSLIEKLFAPPIGYNPARLRQQRAAVGELAAFLASAWVTQGSRTGLDYSTAGSRRSLTPIRITTICF